MSAIACSDRSSFKQTFQSVFQELRHSLPTDRKTSCVFAGRLSALALCSVGIYFGYRGLSGLARRRITQGALFLIGSVASFVAGLDLFRVSGNHLRLRPLWSGTIVGERFPSLIQRPSSLRTPISPGFYRALRTGLGAGVNSILWRIARIDNTEAEADIGFFQALREIGSKQSVVSPDDLDGDPVGNRFARFTNVHCPKVTALSEVVDGETHYLHANRVDMPYGQHYIAAQGPTPWTSERFWRLVSRESSLIVDLARPGEADAYLPLGPGQSWEQGDITVTCTEEPIEIDAALQMQLWTYRLVDERDGVEKSMYRLSCNAWPDFGVVDSEGLGRLISELDKTVSERLQLPAHEPITVHCRAGVGRTGTLISSRVLRAMAEEQPCQTEEAARSRAMNVILLGRLQRGPLFVQSNKQLQQVLGLSDALVQAS